MGLLAGFVFVVGGSPAAAQDYSPPVSYYQSLAGSSALPEGDTLRRALHDIIDGHTVISYGDLPEFFEVIDRDPANASNVILLYSGYSVSGTSFSWNREHTWPRSYGADTGPAYSDAHHLFPTDVQANSDRSNYGFDNLTSGSPLQDAPESIYNSSLQMVEPRDADKGRIARSLFYMEVRYDGSDSRGDFVLSDYLSMNDERHGKLSALLEWNRAYPPDDRERRRNHLIAEGTTTRIGFRLQGNRNPFVDYPGLADLIYEPSAPTSWHVWQLENFTFAELDAGLGAEMSDPDSDGLSNLMEFAIQTNPRDFFVPELFTVTTSSSGNNITFNRVSDPARSYISYAVEESINPNDPTSWVPLSYDERDLQIAYFGDYEQVSLYHQPTHTAVTYYRLVITRTLPGSAPVTTFFPYDMTRYTLSVSASAGGEVSLVSEGYVEPTTVEISATPAPGFLFAGWSGAEDSNANPLQLLVDTTLFLQAAFTPDLADPDSDGLSNYEEIAVLGTDPNQFDSSGDGLGDGALYEAGFDPTVDFGALKAVVESSMVYVKPGVMSIQPEADGTVRLQFDVERSQDLETWTKDPADRVEKVLERSAQTEFYRLNAPD